MMGERTVEMLMGPHAIREALRAGRRRIARVFLAEGMAAKGAVEDILQLCRSSQIPVLRVNRGELDRLGGGISHQGVAAEVSGYPYAALDDCFASAAQRDESPFLLVLDSLQDPQNVGSLLRTAEAVGIHGVILPARRAVAITPAVSRASAGSVEHLLVAVVTNLARALAEIKDRGTWIVGVEARPDAADYRRVDLDMPLALVVGSEGHGMRRLVADSCDLCVRIPMRGQVESLNVAVAGSLVLYRAWEARERR